MKRIMKLKKVLKLSFALTICFSTFAMVTNNDKSIEAASALPEGAQPVLKSGTLFGGSRYDFNVGGVNTNALGQTGFCHGSYQVDGDFNLPLTTGKSPVALFTIVNADGTIQKHLKLSANFGYCTAVNIDSENNFYLTGMVKAERDGVLTGPDTAKGLNDLFAAKVSSTGELIWYRLYGGIGDDNTAKATIDIHGDLVLVADTTGAGEGFGTTVATTRDLLFMKINLANGDMKGQPVRRGGSGNDSIIMALSNQVRKETKLIQDSQGNFYVDFTTNSPYGGDITRGSKDYDIGLFKLDNNFNVVKYFNYGGNGRDETNGLLRTSTGTLITTFTSTSTDLSPHFKTTMGGTNALLVEFTEDFVFKNGTVIGGSGNDAVSAYQISPAGDIVILGSTSSTDGTFANRLSTNAAGYALNLDPVTYQVKNDFYFGSQINTVIYQKTEGNFSVLGNGLREMFDETITGVGHGGNYGANTDLANIDFVYAIFGPTENTPSFINAPEHGYALVGTSGTTTELLNASIGDYDTFISQSDLKANPAIVSTQVLKSYKVTFTGNDAPSKVSTLSITANALPLVAGKQLIDAPSTMTVTAETDLTAEKLKTMGKISAWNIDTNEKYEVTVNASDLAAVNAVTTTTTVVPVRITIPTVTRAVLTKTIDVRVVTKAVLIQEIKAEAETIWGGDQTEFANTAAQAVAVGTKSPDEIMNELATTTVTPEESAAEMKGAVINVDTDGDGIPDYNIDLDGDGIPDLNVDTTGEGVATSNVIQTTNKNGLNYDANGDGIPDTNIDVDGNGTADTNIDVDGDGKPDINIDYDHNKTADLNIDTNADNKPDVNLIQKTNVKGLNYDKDNDGYPDLNIDLNNDGTAELNIDVDGDGVADINIDANKDGKAELNLDINNDGKADINIDNDKDGVADLNVDTNKDNKPDFNIDYNNDKVADFGLDTDNDKVADSNLIQRASKTNLNYDKDGDGYPDNNLDMNNDGVADVNIDKDGDGVADLNLDKNRSGIAVLNIDKNNDGIADVNIDRNNDGVAELSLDTTGDGNADLNIDTNNDGTADVNIDTNDDGKPDINIDTNGDNVADINIDVNNDRTPDINIDTNGDKKADLNIDTNNDRIADVNVDTNGDNVADINIDTNGDNVADINIDTNNDGTADINLDTNGDKKANINIDTDGDNIADVNVDTNGDRIADVNIDVNGDGVADVNIDDNNDGTADTNLVQSTDPAGLNYDKNGDNIPDLNVDIDGDGVADLNIDTNADGKADLNVDTTGDGNADLNIDIDADGVADLNIDTTGDGKANLNVDIDGDGVADLNIDTDGDWKADKNIDADGDGIIDALANAGSSSQLLSTGMSVASVMFAGLIALVLFVIRRSKITVK